MESTLEVLSQCLITRNVLVHGLPNTTAVSRAATLERVVKAKVDSVELSRGSSSVSQSIPAVTRIGKPGTGIRPVLEYSSSSQAKHRAYALSRQLRQQGMSLNDELHSKQQQTQKALEPVRIALIERLLPLVQA